MVDSLPWKPKQKTRALSTGQYWVVKIDTGSQCDVMPRSTSNEAGTVGSVSSAWKLVYFSGHETKTDVIVLYQDRYYVTEVQVVEGDAMPVAGLKDATGVKSSKETVYRWV